MGYKTQSGHFVPLHHAIALQHHQKAQKEMANSHFILNSINAHLFCLARWQIADDQ